MIEFIFYALITIFCIMLVKWPWLLLVMAACLFVYGLGCTVKSIWKDYNEKP